MSLHFINWLFIPFSQDKELYRSIRNLFGFYPSNIHLFKVALCHKSAPSRYFANPEINNERLEYLGDAVLSSVIADYLYKKFPLKPEGFLTEMRSKIVSRSNLNSLSRKMGIDKLVLEEKDFLRPKSKSIFGDTFEAIIGAIYIDQGYNSTKKVIIKRILKFHLDIDEIEKTEVNFKSRLIEYSQKEKKNVEFKVLCELGEGYGKQYLIEVYVNNMPIARAQDFSIKGAEQRAAELACEKIFAEEE